MEAKIAALQDAIKSTAANSTYNVINIKFNELHSS
jgi:hypothetical protein